MTLLAVFQNEMGKGGLSLLQHLNAHGHAAFLVGGCVRDAMLQRPVKDIDIATSATPQQVLALFPQAIPTGIRHGTVTVPLWDYHYEITTFRAESDYSDGRHPEQVTFISDIQGDLERRDFTMNAMALDREGQLIDPFGGVSDIESGILRAVGRAAERFQEDALRMLRCIRFAAEYGLRIEEQTWNETALCAPGLSRIAMERVRAELDRMIGGSDPYRAIRLLRESRLLHWCKQRLRLPDHLGMVESGQEGDPLKRLPALEKDAVRWALWFQQMSFTPEEAANECKRLTHPNALTNAVLYTLKLHQSLRTAPVRAAKEAWITSAIEFGIQYALLWLDWARHLHKHPDYLWMERYSLHGEGWLKDAKVLALKDLQIDGRKVMEALGKKGGPWLKNLLQRLLREAALGRIQNNEQALLTRAVEMAKVELREER